MPNVIIRTLAVNGKLLAFTPSDVVPALADASALSTWSIDYADPNFKTLIKAREGIAEYGLATDEAGRYLSGEAYTLAMQGAYFEAHVTGVGGPGIETPLAVQIAFCVWSDPTRFNAADDAALKKMQTPNSVEKPDLNPGPSATAPAKASSRRDRRSQE
jgi:hypothetical protein